jgi:hypothetical protein
VGTAGKPEGRTFGGYLWREDVRGKEVRSEEQSDEMKG